MARAPSVLGMVAAVRDDLRDDREEVGVIEAKQFESADGAVIVKVKDGGEVIVTDGTDKGSPYVILAGASSPIADLQEVIRLLQSAKAYVRSCGGRR